MTSREIAEKYVYGKHDALTDSQEIIDMIKDIEEYVSDLRKELEVTDNLLEERQRVLDTIPECKSHGSCVPHAIEWIEDMKTKHC